MPRSIVWFWFAGFALMTGSASGQVTTGQILGGG